MGLADRIASDRDERLIKEAKLDLDRVREEQVRQEQCIVLVTETLRLKASGLQEPLEQVDDAIGLPKYYVLGGVVIAVQMFTSHIKEIKLPDPITAPELVTAQYYMSVVGADKRSPTSVETIRVGTVKYLDYEGLYKTLSNAPSYLDFDAGEVLKRLGLR